MGWAVWFLYACGPPLFFLACWVWVRHRERNAYCIWCKRWHGRDS
jgi:hypothetical protein